MCLKLANDVLEIIDLVCLACVYMILLVHVIDELHARRAIHGNTSYLFADFILLCISIFD